MAYTPTTWVDGSTPVNAANLNKIEQGVDVADQAAVDAAAAAAAAQTTANGAIPKTLVDAKGDLLVASADNVLARLAKGPDGQVLTADAAQALGLKWAPVAGGGGADLSYDGDWVAGTYQDGDVVVKDGIAYLCVGGPTAVAPDPAPWGAARPTKNAELAYAEIVNSPTGTQTSDATAGTIITLPTIALDGVTPIDIDLDIPLAQHTAATYVLFSLWDGATQIGRIGSLFVPSAGNGEPFRGIVRLTPSAGAHSYTIRVHGGATGTWTIVAQTGGAGTYLPASCRITSPSSPIPIIPGASLPVAYGTTLPVSPVDGQEAILVDSLTNPTYQWRFRYNAGASGPYKWEFIGGTPATHNVNTAETCATSGSFQNVATNGPLITLPRAGDYRADALVSGNAGSTVPNTLIAGIGVGDFTSPVNSATWYGTPATITGMLPILAELLGRAAGDVIKLRYRTSAGTSAWFGERTLRITPVRVA